MTQAVQPAQMVTPLTTTAMPTVTHVPVTQINTVTSQSALPQLPSVLGALTLSQAPGNLEPLLSMHVAQVVKNKIWAC